MIAVLVVRSGQRSDPVFPFQNGVGTVPKKNVELKFHYLIFRQNNCDASKNKRRLDVDYTLFQKNYVQRKQV